MTSSLIDYGEESRQAKKKKIKSHKTLRWNAHNR